MPSDPFGEEPQNQSPPFTGRNLYESDPLLVALSNRMSDPVRLGLSELGAKCGSADMAHLAMLANKNRPILKTHNEQGKRIDRVEFHPSYHALMRRSVGIGLQGSVWDENQSGEGQTNTHHQTRAIRFYLTAQVECGHLCPLTMTNAAPATLRYSPRLAQDWVPLIRSRIYDASHIDAARKKGVTIGMAMTEKQGGTDIRANVTRAERTNSDVWLVSGHKWFMSAPMSDAFLVLAQSDNGLSCFFIPRFLPDGKGNNIRLQRLKDKLGNISNASSEVEFHKAGAFLVGAEAHGMRTIMDMVTLTRLDCALASAGIMRAGISHALHHTRHRMVSDKALIDQPLMTRVLADMALDCAAATVLSLRLAESFDRAAYNPGEALFARLMTPVVKYWVTKTTPSLIAETMECMGGNGYIEDWPMARFYREAPVNAIWEGSGNVMCLDVLRTLKANPDGLDAVLSVVDQTFGAGKRALSDVVRQAAAVALQDEGSARILTEQLALTVAAGELHRLARSDIADAFLDGRLSRPFRSTYGMMDGRFDARGILEAMYPG